MIGTVILGEEDFVALEMQPGTEVLDPAQIVGQCYRSTSPSTGACRVSTVMFFVPSLRA